MVPFGTNPNAAFTINIARPVRVRELKRQERTSLGMLDAIKLARDSIDPVDEEFTGLLEPGVVVADTYRINELIGRGGMAFVYRATQAAIRRQVALKIIRPRLLTDEDTVRRFVMEARTAGRIPAHPNIVTVFEAGIVEPHGVPFLAMELCLGQTLRARIDARGALPWPEVNTLLDQLGEGLDAAHAAGVVHRDLNPGNIMVHEDHKGRSRLKLLDFGIAQFAEDARSRTATTIGTPSYSAPEQFGSRVRGLAASKGFTITRGVGPTTDVWALGMIAFELLTGQHIDLYWGEGLAGYVPKAALQPRERPSERAGEYARHLPPGFDDWFCKCAAHDADARWASAGEASSALSSLLTRA
jgi:serine/threonine-protein kinase